MVVVLPVCPLGGVTKSCGFFVSVPWAVVFRAGGASMLMWGFGRLQTPLVVALWASLIVAFLALGFPSPLKYEERRVGFPAERGIRTQGRSDTFITNGY